MRVPRCILLPAVPGLMCAIGVHADVRFGWQLCALWLGAAAFCCWLRSWWWRAFWVLAVAQTALRDPMLPSYMMLVMIGLGLAAAQAFSEMAPARVMDWICAAGLLLTGWIALQHVFGFSTFGIASSAAGPFNRNSASALLAMCLPAFFRPRTWVRDRGLEVAVSWRSLAVMVIAGIFMCRSTTGVIAALAALAVCVILFGLPRRWLVAGLAAVAVLTGLFFWRIDPIDTLKDNQRWAAWRHTALSYRSAPMGRGLGSFSQLFPLMTAGDKTLAVAERGRDLGGGRFEIQANYRWDHAHNEFLEAGFELGLLAPLLLAGYLAAAVKSGWGRLQLDREEKLILAGVAATATAAAGFHIFHIAPVALVGCAWIGMAHGIMRRSK